MYFRFFLSALMYFCAPITLAQSEITISEFARNVTRHVLTHELAHALIREFGLPILANEEAMADSFATVWIIQNHYNDAPGIVLSRVRSLVLEDAEFGPDNYDFKGEHLLDIRRAYQAACLFYGADPEAWKNHIEWLDLSEGDLADCSDTAPDQIEGWASIIEPLLLPDGEKSDNVEVIYGEGPMKASMLASGLMEEFANDVRRFDWPNTITVHFDHCDRGAYWNRNDRVIMLCDNYVKRFIHQGKKSMNSK